MVSVRSSMFRSDKPFVSVEVYGINTVIDELRQLNVMIETKTELELARQGNFLQQEVQESIIGTRAETKSVDTGRFANSIRLDVSKLKAEDKEIIVYTPVEYGIFLEYGTVFMEPRSHFRNTLERNRQKVIDDLQQAIKNISFRLKFDKII